MKPKLVRRPQDAGLAARLRGGGVVVPWIAVQEARRAKLPIALAAALLEQESSGGHNVFGHDPVKHPQILGGPVTRERYDAYLGHRKEGLGMQGVGPCQLTFFSIQDQADEIGGCWLPICNVRIGFDLLAAGIRAHGQREGIRRYNAGNQPRPIGDEYAKAVLARFSRWERILAPSGAARPDRALLWRRWLVGDVDFDSDLKTRLAFVARDLGRPIFVRSGRRTLEEQRALWERHQRDPSAPVAAFPNPNAPHIRGGGSAADCQYDDARFQNIGNVEAARSAMRKYDLCLPVPGEPWHVERGDRWSA